MPSLPADEWTDAAAIQPMQTTRSQLIGLLALIVTGAAIRAPCAFTEPLWFDEADTWRSAVIDHPTLNEQGLPQGQRMSYGEFFRWENHFETAPLSFLLARLSCDIFGSDAEWAMRMPSLIAGVLCIPMMFLLGRVVHGGAVGLIAAALIAFDPNMVDQAQQARMYAVLMLLLLIVLAWSIHLLRDPWRAPGERRVHPVVQWLGLGVALGLLFSTSQFTVAAWVGVFLAVVALPLAGFATGKSHGKTMKVWAAFFVAYAIGLAVGAVGVIKLFQRIGGGGEGDGAHLTLMEIAREIIVAAKDLIGWGLPGLIVYVFAAIGLLLLARKCKTSFAILVAVAAVNILILFPFRRMHHFMDGRYLTLLQPTLFVGLAMFVMGWRRNLHRNVAFGLIGAYLILQGVTTLQLRFWRPQPDRYVFAERIMDVRDRMAADEAASLHPGVAVILGQYYELPQDKVLFESMYHWRDHYPLDDATIPESFDAKAVWLILGMNNYEGQYDKARRPLELLAKHYGVEVDRYRIEKHFKRDHVVVLKFSAAGIEVNSYGVGGGMW